MRPAILPSLLLSGLCAVSLADEAPPYREELLSLHKSLVDIPSVSLDEVKVGEFLIDYLTEKGFTTERQPLNPSNTSAASRFNVLAWPSDRPSNWSRVIVTSHMDVVPPYIPYSRSGPDDPPTNETVLAGRGTADAKGSVAVQITALLELLADESVNGDDVMLVFVVGEEIGGDGMRFFSNAVAKWPEEHKPRAAIFGEPTEGLLTCGHKGILMCDVLAQGKSGHSGYPETGKSANEVLMRALLQAIDADLGSSEQFGNTTFNAGMIQGGIAANVIPEAANASVAVRVALGPQASGHEAVKDKIENILKDVDDDALELKCSVGYGAVEANCDVEGFETGIVNYGTDMPNLKGNHTRYLYGPGTILVAHTRNEFITVGDLESAVEGYKKLILHAVETTGSN
jgi:acetylornithine deacetylase